MVFHYVEVFQFINEVYQAVYFFVYNNVKSEQKWKKNNS